MDYYNEIDRFATQWLRNLADSGVIPGGQVDERSICDVRAEDLTGFRRVHLFAGIGGWAEALRNAGWPSHIPVWSGSCPCQPFSAAGKRQGEADERHLWPEMFRLIQGCRPPVVVGEQVSQKAGIAWLDGVCDDLEGIGYTCGAYDLAAGCFGAPHRRQRLYWFGFLGNSNGGGYNWRQDTAITAEQGLAMQTQATSATCSMGHADSPECCWTEAREQSLHQHGDSGCSLGNSNGEGLQWEGWPEIYIQRSEQGGAACSLGHAPGVLGGGWCDESEWGPQGRDVCPWGDSILLSCADGKVRRIGSRVFPLAHGIPRSVGPALSTLLGVGDDAKRARTVVAAARRSRAGRLRGYGNAIVPYVAAKFLRSVLEDVLCDTQRKC